MGNMRKNGISEIIEKEMCSEKTLKAREIPVQIP